MKKSLLFALPIAALLAVPAPAAQAVTHSPCTVHNANAPYINGVNELDQVELYGSGYIAGCPSPIGTESVTLTVVLQHSDDGVTYTSEGVPTSGTRAWSRISRWRTYSLDSNLTVCVKGWWRTAVDFTDVKKTTKYSTPVFFGRTDETDCAYGGAP